MKITLKCENCGAVLNLAENENDTYVCSHCGQKQLIKEDQIHLHQNVIKTVYENKYTFEEYLDKAETFIALKDYKKAFDVIDDAITDCPEDYRGWFAKAKVHMAIYEEELSIDNFCSSDTNEDDIEEYLDKAFILADDTQKAEINDFYKKWQERLEPKLKAFEKKKLGKNIYVEANFKKSWCPLKLQFYATICVPIIALIVPIILGTTVTLIVGLSIFAVFAVLALLSCVTLEKKLTLVKVIKKYRLIGLEELKGVLIEYGSRFRSLDLAKQIRQLIEERQLVGYEIKYGRIKKVRP